MRNSIEKFTPNAFCITSPKALNALRGGSAVVGRKLADSTPVGGLNPSTGSSGPLAAPTGGVTPVVKP